MCMRACVCLFVRVYAYFNVFLYLCESVSVCLHACMYVCLSIYVCACVFEVSAVRAQVASFGSLCVTASKTLGLWIVLVHAIVTLAQSDFPW